MALIRTPDLHLVDAIWVAHQSNYYGDAVRQDVLLASTDPFAVDWYASEYLLRLLTGSQSTSAARSGTFRSATRVNQNVARQLWSGGGNSYPYIDLLDGYDGNTPTDEEKDQMNAYLADSSASSLTLVSPNGGEVWRAGGQYPIKWTWSGEIGNVHLSYSTDGFTSRIHTIVGSTPNTGSYVWTTPVTPSASVQVRVADVLNPDVYDGSDADFVLLDLKHSTFLPLITRE
jgi:hypothetical protein